MLDLLGTIGGNAFSLPGVLGLTFGMMTRSWIGAGLMGAGVGLVETLIFAEFEFAKMEAMELLVALAVGVLAASLGCAIRHKGATV